MASCEHHPFNGDPIVGEEIASLAKLSGAQVMIECGTYRGNSTKEFACMFPVVHTIECVGAHYIQACLRLKIAPNITCHYGTSAEILKLLLPLLGDHKFIMAYLDAHLDTNWETNPLREEIRLIGAHRPDRAVLIIDDIVVPGSTYQNDGITYEGIKRELDGAFPSGYTYYYLGDSQSVYNCPVGKLYIVPRALELPAGRIKLVNGVPRSTLT